MVDYILDLLNKMDCRDLDYDEWLRIGMALKEEGYSPDVWESFSSKDYGRYHEGECHRKWNSFQRSDVTGATITQIAKDHGWFEGARTYEFDEDVDIMIDDSDFNELIRNKVVDPAFMDGKELPSCDFIDEKWRGQQALGFIKTIFKPGDIIGYTYETYVDEDGKWKPGNPVSNTYENIVRNIEKHPEDLSYAFASHDKNAGLWVRSNPMDGNGFKNENVAEFRYALIESDSISIEKQYELMLALNLPIATLTHSGGKSLHALVRINALNKNDYQDRVRKLYAYCDRNGLAIDKQNKNPSRLTRMPGFERGGNYQYLIGCNIGPNTWDEWYEYIQEEQDDLPDIVDFTEVVEKGIPDLSPELIFGILRQGHKMLLAGPSKAGKSFCLIQLAIAIATGSKWLGKGCKKGKVLYINLELDENSCYHRIKDVSEKMLEGIGGTNAIESGNLAIWNLRGKQQSMKTLTPRLVRRIKDKGYAAVILDPIYKVTAGDENSAEAMGEFCNALDRVCQEADVSLIYCHHHSKGAQGHKSSMDRASGSGVFARDADAIMDMLQLEIKDEYRDEVGPSTTAWRIEYSLREFAEPKPLNVFFRFPVHEIDENEILEGARTEEQRNASDRGNATQKAQKEDRKSKLFKDIESGLFSFDGSDPLLKDVAEGSGISEKTIRRYVKDNPKFEIYTTDDCQPSKIRIIR